MGTFEGSVTINPDKSWRTIDVYYPSGVECNIGGIVILAPPSRVTPVLYWLYSIINKVNH